MNLVPESMTALVAFNRKGEGVLPGGQTRAQLILRPSIHFYVQNFLLVDFFIFNSEIIKSTNFQRRVRAFGDIVPVQFVAQRVFADSAMAYLLSDKPSCVLTSFLWSYMILGIEGKETFSIQSVHLICVFSDFVDCRGQHYSHHNGISFSHRV